MRVDSTEFSLTDGSGLSSGNLVSPVAFTQILRFIRAHPRCRDFRRRAAAVGQRRVAPEPVRPDTPLEGRVRAKTGSISRVNTLSGYIERPDGRGVDVLGAGQPPRAGGRTVIQQIDSVVVEMGR